MPQDLFVTTGQIGRVINDPPPRKMEPSNKDGTVDIYPLATIPQAPDLMNQPKSEGVVEPLEHHLTFLVEGRVKVQGEGSSETSALLPVLPRWLHDW